MSDRKRYRIVRGRKDARTGKMYWDSCGTLIPEGDAIGVNNSTIFLNWLDGPFKVYLIEDKKEDKPAPVQEPESEAISESDPLPF